MYNIANDPPDSPRPLLAQSPEEMPEILVLPTCAAKGWRLV